MQKIEGKHKLSHHLHPYYDEIKSYKKKKDFIQSDFYASHKNEINTVIKGLEWNNTLSDAPEKKDIKIVSWNIERGKQLDNIITFFEEDPLLSKADIVLAIECDNGMGRTNNRNVTKELAAALGMNYCFAPSYLVLGKGAIGETQHQTKNTTALHGTSILSKYKIELAEGVEVPPVKEVFHSSEKRMGCKRGLVAKVNLGSKSIALGAIHIDLSSTAKDRANQLEAVLNALPEADMQLIGGDFNCSTFQLRRKWELAWQVITKFFTVGFKGAIENYMTPELKFDKPMFDVLLKYGFDFNSFNDREKGTIYFDMNDMLTNEKSQKFVPDFFLRYLERKLRPWNGCVPLKIDWLAGKNSTPSNPQTIERPKANDTLLSDHNPILVDINIT
ncbi:MAG: endonuclease/exonuclease/phosphatase family protein [Vicingaceae bacterium]